MIDSIKISRRGVLATPALLSLASSSMAASMSDGPRADTLVAYFSRSGNTRVVAGQIRRAVGGDLFEINPARPYPEDYEETVEQARLERDGGLNPDLAATIADLTGFRTIYLGFPIWGETAPPVIRSFLATHDLSGTLLVPFITHGGYGLGSSRAVIEEYVPNATLAEGFSMQADQERRTLSLVTEWLGR